MKYWNKKIRFKDAGWHKVVLPDPIPDLKGLKVWCQQQPGRGKFYWAPYSNTWYFELGKDATWFTLNWA